MKQITKTKILRKVLILAFLVAGLVVIELNTSIDCSAIPCSEARQNYENADNAYYSARLSYFNGAPTTCDYECRNATDKQQCINNCQTTRATAYYDAQLDLFAAAEGTCAPEGLYYTCAEANQAAYNCEVLYDYSS